MKVFLLVVGGFLLLCFALVYPAPWWQKPPARQRDRLIGKLLPFLHISLRNLLLRGLFLVLTIYFYLTAIIWVPILAAIAGTILILGGLWQRLCGKSSAPVIGLIALMALGVVFLIGLVAPLRLLPLAGYLALGRPAGNSWEALTVGPGWLFLDTTIGLCGLFGVASWLVVDAVWRFRQATQIDNLATSKIGALALGLVEVKGFVRPLPGMAAEPPVELRYGGFDYFRASQRIEQFLLEDGTGSVLVDATACRVRTSWIAELSAIFGVREIVLRRRVERDDFADTVTRKLEYGDRVYLIGTAERDDIGRLVIRPAARPGWNEMLWKTFFGAIRPPKGRDIHDVFFLTDGGDAQAKRHILRGFRRVLGWGVVWIIASILIIWTARQPWRQAPPLDSWRTASWRGPEPDPNPRIIDYSRNQRLYRFEKYLKSPVAGTADEIPALIEALQYRDVRFKLQATRALLRLPGHARAAELVPVLAANLNGHSGHLLQETILAISRFGPEAVAAVPALILQLNCRSTDTYEVPPAVIRFQAARALGEIGPGARAALPDLTELLQDPSAAVRDAAGLALRKIALRQE